MGLLDIFSVFVLAAVSYMERSAEALTQTLLDNRHLLCVSRWSHGLNRRKSVAVHRRHQRSPEGHARDEPQHGCPRARAATETNSADAGTPRPRRSLGPHEPI